MSNLSDFFPGAAGGAGAGTNITVVMVGGGGGSGTNRGAGAGGYFYGRVPVTPGVSYPVVIGTGGSPGNPASCATTAGLGNPGSPSRFGRYEALGGGGGATLCGSVGSSFHIPGAPGGSAGGISEVENTCFGPVGQCICPVNTTFYSSGASQRTFSPNGYCGSLTNRNKTLCTFSVYNFDCLLSGTKFARKCNPTATAICPEFFGVCLASVPYTFSPAPTIPTLTNPYLVRNLRAGSCNRTILCGCPTWDNANVILNCPNTGFGSLCPTCNGDSGVVLVAYPCVLPAATSFPGAVDCSPVSIPQNGYRTYKFTSSGSFTL